MGTILLFLLSLYQLHAITNSELLNKPRFDVNALLENDDDMNILVPPEVEELPEDYAELPYVKAGHDQTEVEFKHPISSVNIDYSKNMIVLKFRKHRTQLRFKLDPEEEEKRRALEANFMRFGKRQMEELPNANSIDSGYFDKESSGRQERSTEGLRDSRGDNFMRFGRDPNKDFMRFGRDPNKDFMRFGRDPNKDFMRFGRDPNKDFMRFGRAPADFMRFGRDPNKDFMRFGRDPSKDFMRFGRTPADFMRFGKNPSKDFMRFGRAQKLRQSADKNFIRFGRPDNFMRFGRSPPETTDTTTNFMRFGKMDQNFMRFGKSLNAVRQERNQTKPLLQKSDVREAAKLLRQTDKNADESNPMDKAIKVFFSKQHQQEQEQPDGEQQQEHQQELKSSEEEAMDLDADYGFNIAN